MKHTYDRASGLSSNIRQALQVATTDNETLFKVIMNTFEERDNLRSRASALTKELDDLAKRLDTLTKERTSDYKGLVALTEAVTGEPAENDFLSPDVLTTLISELRTERDKLIENVAKLRTEDEQVFKALADAGHADESVTLLTLVKRLVAGRDGLQKCIGDIAGALRLERSVHPYHVVAGINDLVSDRDNLLAIRNELTKRLDTLRQGVIENGVLPEGVLGTLTGELGDTLRKNLSELATLKLRYIIHGHVQPCVVLYSDETTTLVRLDEGDMMCETSTIQWSDSLTYRCQELLASAGVERGSMAAQRVLPVLSELVRDERVTLNDEGVAVEQPEFVALVSADDDSELGADPAYFQKPCNTCGHLFYEDDQRCPMCGAYRTPVPADDATSEVARAYRASGAPRA